jgi:hypothetical protein
MARRSARFHLTLGDITRSTDTSPEMFLRHKHALMAHMSDFMAELDRYLPRLAGLYRDSRVLRHAGHSRASAMISLLAGNFKAKHVGCPPLFQCVIILLRRASHVTTDPPRPGARHMCDRYPGGLSAAPGRGAWPQVALLATTAIHRAAVSLQPGKALRVLPGNAREAGP